MRMKGLCWGERERGKRKALGRMRCVLKDEGRKMRESNLLFLRMVRENKVREVRVGKLRG